MSKSRISLRLVAGVSVVLFMLSLMVPGVSDWSIWLMKGSGKLIAGLIALVLLIIWWMQGYLLYMPNFAGRFVDRPNDSNPAGFRSPTEHDLPFVDCMIDCKDGVTIHAWFITQQSIKQSAPTIVFLHGNAGNIGFRLINTKAMYDVIQCNVLLVEYRGFGCSAGKPSELGLKRDAAAALSYLHSLPDIDHRKIFLFGRSLGGAVSVDLAYQNSCIHHSINRSVNRSINQSYPLAGIILENTFSSLEDMVVVLAKRFVALDRVEKLIRVILRYFMTSHWTSNKLIGSVTCPILFISGLKDELVPACHMQQLYDAAIKSSHRQIHYVPDGDHNSTYLRGGLEYWRCFTEFVHSRCKMIDDKHDVYPEILSTGKWPGEE